MFHIFTRFLLVSFLITLPVAAIGNPDTESGPQAAESPTPTTDVTPYTMAIVSPDFVAASVLLEFLGTTGSGALRTLEWGSENDRRRIEIRCHDTANRLLLTGSSEDVEYAKEMIQSFDVAPRQIEVEAKVIEVNESRLLDAGIDWQDLVDNSAARYNFDESQLTEDRETEINDRSPEQSKTVRTTTRYNVDASARLERALHVLDESGAGTIRTVPRVLTLNNREASILDGSRVTYVTRYSSFTNLYETDTMDAGLSLKVRPALGETGLLSLDIRAEMTELSGAISGSPIKSGQIVENTVVVQDGESVVLGGFTRVAESKTHRRLPVLGHVLPFLFSREVRVKEDIQVFIVLTARVIDLESNLAPIEGLGE